MARAWARLTVGRCPVQCRLQLRPPFQRIHILGGLDLGKGPGVRFSRHHGQSLLHVGQEFRFRTESGRL